MILDLDDQSEQWNALPYLHELRKIRSDFRCTLFAIPAKGDTHFWMAHPDWIELVPHGWQHTSPHECEHWGVARMRSLLDEPIVKEHFPSKGWKSPGWLVSDGTYQALLERGYWIADHPKNNDIRPQGLRTHMLGAPDSWHGHTHNVCGNGIEECFAEVEALVRAADTFQFVSEVVK